MDVLTQLRQISDWLMIGVEYPDMIDLGKVVVFTGQPEDCNMRLAADGSLSGAGDGGCGAAIVGSQP